MSKTKPVGRSSRGPQYGIWVYDAGLSVLLAQLLELVEAMPISERPVRWAAQEEVLRIQATVSDLFFDLDELLGDASSSEGLAGLFELAADGVAGRGVLTGEQAAAWTVHGDVPVIFRGVEPMELGPVAELGHAVASLIRGTCRRLRSGPGGTTERREGGRRSGCARTWVIRRGRALVSGDG